MLSTEFKLALVHGLMAIGLFDDALRLVNETIHMIEANGDHAYTPEALRVKARVLLSMPERRQREAETCLVQSIDWSRRQDAKSWELRTAVDLAMLWATQRQRQQAHSLLKSIFDRFTEGFNMADLQAAEQTLTILR